MSSTRGVVVSIIIDAPLSVVWEDVSDISSHVEWMSDATEIRFLGDQSQGLGTKFECDTTVGPFSMTDVMEITAWSHGQTIGVRHIGLVQGEGEFTLRAIGSGRTEFTWSESLTFPWFMAASLGAFIARPIFRMIWKGNLAKLKQRIEGAQSRSGS